MQQHTGKPGFAIGDTIACEPNTKMKVTDIYICQSSTSGEWQVILYFDVTGSDGAVYPTQVKLPEVIRHLKKGDMWVL